MVHHTTKRILWIFFKILGQVDLFLFSQEFAAGKPRPVSTVFRINNMNCKFLFPASKIFFMKKKLQVFDLLVRQFET